MLKYVALCQQILYVHLRVVLCPWTKTACKKHEHVWKLLHQKFPSNQNNNVRATCTFCSCFSTSLPTSLCAICIHFSLHYPQHGVSAKQTYLLRIAPRNGICLPGCVVLFWDFLTQRYRWRDCCSYFMQVLSFIYMLCILFPYFSLSIVGDRHAFTSHPHPPMFDYQFHSDIQVNLWLARYMPEY